MFLCRKSSQFQFPLRPEAINALLDFRDGRLVYLKLKVNVAGEEIQLADKATGNQHQVLSGSPFDLTSEEQLKRRLLPTSQVEKSLTSSYVEDGNVGYHVFTFKHLDPSGGGGGDEGVTSSNGVPIVKVIFAFVMPTEMTTVRQRIAYSACLNSLIDSVSNRIGLPIDKRIEVDAAGEVTAGYVVSKLYPDFDEKGGKVGSLDGTGAAGGRQVDVEPEALKFTKPKGPPSRGPRRIIKWLWWWCYKQIRDVNGGYSCTAITLQIFLLLFQMIKCIVARFGLKMIKI